MLKAGLTGGLATGKSFVAKALSGLGCRIIEADQLGHEVIAPGGAAHDAVVREFGTADRAALAGLVFHHPERLAALNAIVHPAVYAREDELIASHPEGIVVVTAAILIETGSYKRFECLILTVCAPEQQLARALERPGATREDALARMARQWPSEEKKRFADFVVDTSGSKDHTTRQTHDVYDCLKKRLESK